MFDDQRGRSHLRGVDAGDLLSRTRLNELIVNEETCRQGDFPAIGGSELDFQISHFGKQRSCAVTREKSLCNEIAGRGVNTTNKSRRRSEKSSQRFEHERAKKGEK